MRLFLRRYLLGTEKNREWLMREYDFLEEDENSYYTKRLRTSARNLRILMPPMFEGAKVTSDYVSSGLDGKRYYLSISGEQKFRAAIREEKSTDPNVGHAASPTSPHSLG